MGASSFPKDFNFIVLLAIISLRVSVFHIKCIALAIISRSFILPQLFTFLSLAQHCVLLFHKYLRFCELILVYTFLCSIFFAFFSSFSFFFILFDMTFFFPSSFSAVRNNVIWFCNKFHFDCVKASDIM